MSRRAWDFSDEVWERFFDLAEACDAEMPADLLSESLRDMGIDSGAGHRLIRRHLHRAGLQDRLAAVRSACERELAAASARAAGTLDEIKSRVAALAGDQRFAGGLELQFRNLESALTESDWRSLWSDARLLEQLGDDVDVGANLLSDLLPDADENAPPGEEGAVGAAGGAGAERAAGAARALWDTCGWASIDELVLEDVAQALGVVVLDGGWEASDARLLRAGRLGVIRTNAGLDDPQRRRFAVAHELGHWVLHRAGEPLHVCTPDEAEKRYDKGDPQEIEANRFAAELLMPQAHFAADLERFIHEHSELSFAMIERLAERYHTSPVATGVRVAELATEPVALVVSDAGKIAWWRASRALRELGWIRAGATLKPDTAAGRYYAGEPLQHEPSIVDARSWMVRTAGDFKLREESRLLPAYGHVVTLLRIV